MSEKKTYYVCHGMYGCETGCCGYRLCFDDEGDEECPHTDFAFSHPDNGQNAEQFARDEWGDAIEPDAVVKEGKWFRCD